MFHYTTSNTVRFKKTIEVIKDVGMETYIRANHEGLFFYEKSPEALHQEKYTIITKFLPNVSDSKYTFQSDGFINEYYKKFDTHQLYKCIKHLAGGKTIILFNEKDELVIQNPEKNAEDRVKYRNIDPVEIDFSFKTDQLEQIVLDITQYTQLIKHLKATDEFEKVTLQLKSSGSEKHQYVHFYAKSSLQSCIQDLFPVGTEPLLTNEDDKVILEQEFKISTLMLFIKSCNLNTSTLCLYFYPTGIIIQVNIQNLGTMVFFCGETKTVEWIQ